MIRINDSPRQCCFDFRPWGLIRATYLGLVLALLVFADANAAPTQLIRFDEFPADNDSQGGLPSNRYAALGVTISGTDDGSTWGGLSNGDPGNWDLQGTNGPIFSGFNGTSYSLLMNFSTFVTNFSLDVSRSLGSDTGDQFRLEGMQGGVVVESHTITLAGINEWATVSISSPVDAIRWQGFGVGFHPFGVDNIQWRPIPECSTLSLALIGAVALYRRRRCS